MEVEGTKDERHSRQGQENLAQDGELEYDGNTEWLEDC